MKRDRTSATLSPAEEQLLIEPVSPEERRILREALLQAPTQACLSSDELVDYVIGSPSSSDTLPNDVTGSETAAQHVKNCPVCAENAIEIRKAFQPVISLQHDWRGWRGPILAALGLLDPMLKRAWREQCARNLEAARRTERVRRTLGVARPTFTFASGAICTAVLLLFLRPSLMVTPHSTGPTSDMPGITLVPKDGGHGGTDQSGLLGVPQTGNPAESLVEHALNPTDEQLPAAIHIMERIAARNPSLAAPRVALKDLYQRALRNEHDPALRRALQDKIDKLGKS